jgi:hypothetical protein
MSLANTSRKQAGGFQKGQSGNPAGRPAGSRNSATLACEALLEGQAEALTQKAVALALAGDTVALKLCVDRIYPPRKDRPVNFQLRHINCARDAADAVYDVMSAVASGQLTPAEAAEISKVVGVCVKAFEAAEYANREVPVEELSLAELHRIAAGGNPSEVIGRRLLTVSSD